jgi:hypothetical protein
LPGLTALTLQGPGIPDECWPRLLAAPWATRLRRLSLREEALCADQEEEEEGQKEEENSAGLRALAAAPLPALVDLQTCEACLTPADLSGTLAAAPWLRQLTRLHLTSERLGAAGLAALASLRLERLRCLSLKYACTTEAGLAALGEAPWLTRLTRLEVRESVHNVFEEAVDAEAWEYFLEGRGAGNPFAPLARAGAIVTEFS